MNKYQWKIIKKEPLDPCFHGYYTSEYIDGSDYKVELIRDDRNGLWAMFKFKNDKMIAVSKNEEFSMSFVAAKEKAYSWLSSLI